VIQSFANQLTEDVFHGNRTKASRRFPVNLHRPAQVRLTYLNRAKTLQDLRVPPGNRLEQLKGKLAGQYSIRINDQWRIIFDWTEDGPANVEITDYHS
jgi:proteic killer suppression protein